MEEDDAIFDLSLQLPSLEGTQSTCEEELQLLMREVNLAFKRKHRDLLKEVAQLRTSSSENTATIESLKIRLRNAQNNKQHEEMVKTLSAEVEKLKEENSRLKKENAAVQRRNHSASEINKQMESLKRSLAMQQEENLSLKGRLDKLVEKHNVLQENYQKLLNLMNNETREQKPENDSAALDEFIQKFIAQESENFIQEEIDHCDQLQSKVHQEINEFQKNIQEGT